MQAHEVAAQLPVGDIVVGLGSCIEVELVGFANLPVGDIENDGQVLHAARALLPLAVLKVLAGHSLHASLLTLGLYLAGPHLTQSPLKG